MSTSVPTKNGALPIYTPPPPPPPVVVTPHHSDGVVTCGKLGIV